MHVGMQFLCSIVIGRAQAWCAWFTPWSLQDVVALVWLGAALIHALARGMCRIAVLQLIVLFKAADSARASRRQQAALAESPAPVLLLNSGENHSLGSLATPWRISESPWLLASWTL